MICPKCKSKVSNEDIICPVCKLRLIFNCPRCGSPTRLGSVSCKKCSYTFVKFCPQCHSANYNTSSICRKCGFEFVEDEDLKDIKSIKELARRDKEKELTIESIKKPSKKEEVIEPEKKPLLFYIDFINLEAIFEKHSKDEFKQKVIQNIKTTVKIVFNEPCEFISTGVVVLKTDEIKSSKILESIENFEKEFNKFNAILERMLNCTLSYKFAITSIEEAGKKEEIPQLALGTDKDVIVSNKA